MVARVNKMPSVCAIIPARMASTRLPNKVLRNIAGHPMIEWVYKRVSKAVDDVYVATDHIDIKKCVESFGGKALITSEDCATGTDRLIEAIEQLKPYDYVVNVQGDEPLIKTEIIKSSLDTFLNSDNCVMGTVGTRSLSYEDYLNPNTVKVVINHKHEAMYFSRAPIPFYRDKTSLPENCLQHIGLYIYKTEFLKTFSKLPASELERVEKLEQLRALENGYKISVAQVSDKSIGVDTEEDLQKVEQKIKDEMIHI